MQILKYFILYLLACCLLFFTILPAFSQENPQKIYEIATGGSLHFNPGAAHIINRSPSFTASLGFSVPFMLNFYLARMFALGFSAEIGFNCQNKLMSYESSYNNIYHAKYGDFLLFFDITGKLNILAKVGSINSKHRFICEAGIVFTGRFTPGEDFAYHGSASQFTDWHYFISDPYFLTGPDIFVGYQFKKKKYSYICGISFCAQFGKTRYYRYYQIWEEKGDIDRNDEIDYVVDYFDPDDYEMESEHKIKMIYNVSIVEFNLGFEWRFLFSTGAPFNI